MIVVDVGPSGDVPHRHGTRNLPRSAAAEHRSRARSSSASSSRSKAAPRPPVGRLDSLHPAIRVGSHPLELDLPWSDPYRRPPGLIDRSRNTAIRLVRICRRWLGASRGTGTVRRSAGVVLELTTAVRGRERSYEADLGQGERSPAERRRPSRHDAAPRSCARERPPADRSATVPVLRRTKPSFWQIPDQSDRGVRERSIPREGADTDRTTEVELER